MLNISKKIRGGWKVFFDLFVCRFKTTFIIDLRVVENNAKKAERVAEVTETSLHNTDKPEGKS